MLSTRVNFEGGGQLPQEKLHFRSSESGSDGYLYLLGDIKFKYRNMAYSI